MRKTAKLSTTLGENREPHCFPKVANVHSNPIPQVLITFAVPQNKPQTQKPPKSSHFSLIFLPHRLLYSHATNGFRYYESASFISIELTKESTLVKSSLRVMLLFHKSDQ